MKIRLAKKIQKADPYSESQNNSNSHYWKRKHKEAYNEYGCVYFCDTWFKCKYRNKFDHRITKATRLTNKKK